MRHTAKRDFIPRILSLSTFTIVLIFLYIPILVLAVFSFNNSRIIAPWHGFTLKYFFLLFKTREIMSALKNTLVVAVLSTLTSTILGTLTALALENRKFTGRRGLSALIFVPLIMPDILMGVSLALLFNFMRMETGFWTVLIAHITFCLSYTVIVIQSRLQNFDYRLEEAGADLGANKWQIFFKIKLPLLMPAVVAAALLAFTLSIDDFIITFFTTGRGFNTLPIYIEGVMRRGVTTTINALSTLTIGFTLLLAVFSHRFRKLIQQGKAPRGENKEIQRP